jgi:hypothetical protein
VYGDDLSVTTMSKSAQGRMEAPSKNVKQKSRLNRLLQARGWTRAVGIFGLQAEEEVKIRSSPVGP